jgi:hypothetical protein
MLWRVQQAWLLQQSLFFALLPVFFPGKIMQLRKE